MSRKLYFIALLAGLLSSLSLGAHARRSELVDPAPLVLPEGTNLETVTKAVDSALHNRIWVKVSQSDAVPRVVSANYHIRSHTISLKIEFDTASVKFSYLDSVNMKFKEKKGKRKIHPNYMVWTQALADTINSYIELGEEGLAYIPTTTKPLNINLPKEKFSAFSSFKLEKTSISDEFSGHKGNTNAQKNIDHSLNLKISPLLEQWNKKEKTGRVLLIKPHIQAIRFIGTAARFWGGSMVGRSWIFVSVEYIDEATGEVVAKPDLYRVAARANGFSLAARDYKMVEDIAADIVTYTKNNYESKVGGGVQPPASVAKYKK